MGDQYALLQTGFREIPDFPFRPLCKDIFAASEQIKNGQNPQTRQGLSFREKWRVWKADKIEAKHCDKREFITLCAIK